MSGADWNERYASGNLPWDTGQPDPNLVELVESGTIAPGRTLEVGCGTGTNALWLAARGFSVLGVDVSSLAIEAALAKRAALGLDCELQVLDFLDGPAPSGRFDLVFDRGVFHVFDDAKSRSRFAARVAACLAGSGRWLSLIGSTEGPDRDHGPPRRSARDIVDAVEPVLRIEGLREISFDADIPSHALAWALIARPREVPAQPSTRRA